MPPKIYTAVRQQALSAANARKVPDDPLRWSEAMAEAPWPGTLVHVPAYEREFRQIYARRLVQRGAAVKPERTGRSSGPGGKTSLERKTVYLTRAEIDEQEQKATEAELSWSLWARRKLSQ